MHKSAIVNVRIEPILKDSAESILYKIGLSPAEAVRLFYTQICLNNGLPFAISIPTTKTIKAAVGNSVKKKNNNISLLLEDID